MNNMQNGSISNGKRNHRIYSRKYESYTRRNQKNLRKIYPNHKFYNEEIENYIIKATSKDSKLVEKEDDFER